MGMVKEFKQFAMRGNVMDMAVGVIIGGAFGKIVSSLVNDVLMPPIGKLMGNMDFSSLFIQLGGGEKIANTYAVPFLGEIPLSSAVRVAGDSGEPIVEGEPDSPQARTFREVAERLAAQVSIRNFGDARQPAPLAD